MGQFIYNSMIHVTVDDTALAHLEAVVGAKLRVNEPFYFSWNWHLSTSDSRTTVWLHPSISVQYRYLAIRRPALDRIGVAQMLLQANSATGPSITLDQIPPNSKRPRAA
jgi:hypothetical protein